MNIENPITSVPQFTSAYVGTTGSANKAENAAAGMADTLAGPGVTVAEEIRNPEKVATTDEIEKDLVRDDDLGRAMDAALNYPPPAMDFSALE